jgi:hypothetical protein
MRGNVDPGCVCASAAGHGRRARQHSALRDRLPERCAGFGRDHASAPFALTATFVRDMLQSSASTTSTFREVSGIPTDDRQLRERTPPGLSRAPIVTLRI